MVSRYSFFAEPLGQIVGNPLRQAARVDENQGRTMLANQFCDAVVDLVPHLIAGHRSQLAGRSFHGEIEFAPVADVDGDRIRAAAASKEMSDLLNRLLRGR